MAAWKDQRYSVGYLIWWSHGRFDCSWIWYYYFLCGLKIANSPSIILRVVLASMVPIWCLTGEETRQTNRTEIAIKLPHENDSLCLRTLLLRAWINGTCSQYCGWNKGNWRILSSNFPIFLSLVSSWGNSRTEVPATSDMGTFKKGMYQTKMLIAVASRRVVKNNAYHNILQKMAAYKELEEGIMNIAASALHLTVWMGRVQITVVVQSIYRRYLAQLSVVHELMAYNENNTGWYDWHQLKKLNRK